jgi:hypothetical protein
MTAVRWGMVNDSRSLGQGPMSSPLQHPKIEYPFDGALESRAHGNYAFSGSTDLARQ